MDTSETYIKMCDCEEIQGQNTWERCNFYFHPKDGNIITLGEECRDYTVAIDVVTGERFALDDPVIWLPRQDQLQEMVSDKYIQFGLLSACCNWRVNEWEYVEQFTSMEQLWLGFIMAEKYNKVWSGSEWVK